MKKTEPKGILGVRRSNWPPTDVDAERGAGWKIISNLERIVLANVNELLIVWILAIMWANGLSVIGNTSSHVWVYTFLAYSIALRILKLDFLQFNYESHNARLMRILLQIIFIEILVNVAEFSNELLWPALLLPGFSALIYFGQENFDKRLNAVARTLTWLSAGFAILITSFIGILLFQSTSFENLLLTSLLILGFGITFRLFGLLPWNGLHIHLIVVAVYVICSVLINHLLIADAQYVEVIGRAGWLLVLGIILQRLYSFSQVQAYYEKKSNVLLSLGNVGDSIDPALLCEQLVDHIRSFVGSEFCGIYLRELYNESFKLVAESASDSFSPTTYLPREATNTLLKNGPNQLFSVNTHTRSGQQGFFEGRVHARTTALINPITIRDRVVGAVVIANEAIAFTRRSDELSLRIATKEIENRLDATTLHVAIHGLSKFNQVPKDDLGAELQEQISSLVPNSEIALIEIHDDRHSLVESSPHRDGLEESWAILLKHQKQLNGSFFVEDIMEEMNWTPLSGRKFAVRSWLVCEIKSISGFTGVLLIGAENRRVYQRSDLDILREFASQLGLVLGNIHKNRQVNAIASMQATLVSFLKDREANLDDLYSEILRGAVAAFGAEAGSIITVDHPEDTNAINRLKVSATWPENELKTLAIPRKKGIISHVLETQEPYFSPDVKQDNKWNEEIDRLSGFRTNNLVAIPLVDSRGLSLGGIELINIRDSKLGAEDIDWLESLASQVSIAMEMRQRDQGLEISQFGGVHQLYEAILSVSNELGNPNFYARVKDAAVRMVGGKDGSIYLYDKSAHKFNSAATFSGAFDTLEFSANQGISGWVLNYRKSVRISNYKEAVEKLDQYIEEDIAAVIAAPLLRLSKFIGVIVVHKGENQSQFSDQDVKKLELFASQIANLIDLYGRSQSSLLPVLSYGEEIENQLALMSVDGSGIVDRYTGEAERILGFSKMDVLGQRVEKFYAGGKFEASEINRLIRKKETVNGHLASVKTVGGKEERIRLWGERLPNGGSMAFFVRDSEFQLSLARNEFIRWLFSKMPQILEGMSIEELLTDGLTQLRPRLGGPKNLLLYLFDEEQEKLNAPPMSAGLNFPKRLKGEVPSDSLPSLAFNRQEPIAIPNVKVHEMTADADFWRREETNALIGVPLRNSSGQSTGLLIANFENVRAFNEWEIKRYEQFGESLALAIEAIKSIYSFGQEKDLLRQEVRIRNAHLSADPNEFIGRAILQLIETLALKGYSAEVAFLPYVKGSLHKKVRGINPVALAKCDFLDIKQEKACLDVLKQGAPRFYSGTQELCPVEGCIGSKKTNLLLLPIFHEKKKLGLMTITFDKDLHIDKIKRDVYQLVSSFSEAIGMSLYKLVLEEELRDLSILDTLTQEARSGKEEYDLIPLAAQMIKQKIENWLDGDEVALNIGFALAHDKKKVKWTAHASIGFSTGGSDKGFYAEQELNKGILALAFESRRPISVKDIYRDNRVSGFKPKNMHAEMMAPMHFRNEFLGAVDVYSKHVGAFGEDEKRLLMAIVRQLQIAIISIRSEMRQKTEALNNRLFQVGSYIGHEMAEINNALHSTIETLGQEGEVPQEMVRISPIVREIVDVFEVASQLYPGESFRPSPQDLHGLLTEINNDFPGSISISVKDGIKPVMAHGILLKFILRGLISNAIRESQVTPDQLIKINVSEMREDWVQIHLIDPGPGLKKQLDYRMNISGAYGNPTPVHGHFGVSVGEIARLVQQWGGNLELRRVESKAAEDPTAILLLRAAPEEILAKKDVSTRLASTFERRVNQFTQRIGSGKINALVVEDDPESNGRYCDIFEDLGWNVYSARSEQEAIDINKDKQIDLALVDINLTKIRDDKAGIRVAESLRSIVPKPIVILASRFSLIWVVQTYVNEDHADAYWDKRDGEQVLTEKILKPIADRLNSLELSIEQHSL